jgi:hypothetical protein
VPGADVAGAALPVDDGDHAAVGERGDDQPRQAAQRRLAVQRAGQLPGHRGQQRRAGTGPLRGPPGRLGLVLRLPARGDVDEDEGGAVRHRPGVQPRPARAAPGVGDLEGDRPARGHGLVAGPGHGGGRAGAQHLGDRPPDDVGGRAAEQSLALGVEQRDPPGGVETAQRGGQGGQHPGGQGGAPVERLRPPPRSRLWSWGSHEDHLSRRADPRPDLGARLPAALLPGRVSGSWQRAGALPRRTGVARSPSPGCPQSRVAAARTAAATASTPCDAQRIE